MAGRPVHTGELVVSLRAFVRRALGLDPIPADVAIPQQGPLGPSASGGRGKADAGREERGGRGGSGGGGLGGMGGGMGGAGGYAPDDDHDAHRR